jgi:hypothetical protein
MATLQRTVVTALLAAWAASAVAACSPEDSATGLVEEGPPKLRQVFMSELYDDNGTLRIRSILAYGTHDRIPAERTHSTTTAAANTQTIRVVFDEILRGNALEEISCRSRQLSPTTGCVVPGGFSRVPVGATPDDIAACAVANDLLDESCTGKYATCLNPDGIPCGVEDEDENGSADNTRMIAGQVKLMCGDVDVPLDPEQTYYQPAGNQLVPAGQTPEGSLGPALILKPTNSGRLPTGSTCRLVLAGDVVDKDDIAVCAPAGGDPSVDCTPGDLAAFSFGTESLRVSSSTPGAGETGVAVETTSIRIFWNAALAPATVNTTTVTVTPALPPPPAGMPAVQTDSMDTQIRLNTAGPLQGGTQYTVTVDGVTDSFGVEQTAPFTLTFTTI